MFERYSEKARRTIFFARYETSRLGGSEIETEHILLGLFRENKAIVLRYLASIPIGGFDCEFETPVHLPRCPSGIELSDASAPMPTIAAAKRSCGCVSFSAVPSIPR